MWPAQSYGIKAKMMLIFPFTELQCPLYRCLKKLKFFYLLLKHFFFQRRESFEVNSCDRTFMSQLLDRRWSLLSPESKIHQISLSKLAEQQEGQSAGFAFINNVLPSLGLHMARKEKQAPSFYIVRDDMLHPLVNGNKARKLDGLIPLVEDHFVTDVVKFHPHNFHTVSCAERGLKSHLLLRGEQPDIPTGYNLISTIYGNTVYVPRSLYAKREEMLFKHAELVAGSNGSVICFSDILSTCFTRKKFKEENRVHMNVDKSELAVPQAQNHKRKVVVVNEGAGDAAALLGNHFFGNLHGVIRLVEYMSQIHLFGQEHPMKIVVDSGTGTTAIGLALGALCLGLQWEVIAVMLADTVEGYKKQENRLISDFKRLCGSQCVDLALNGIDDDSCKSDVPPPPLKVYSRRLCATPPLPKCQSSSASPEPSKPTSFSLLESPGTNPAVINDRPIAPRMTKRSFTHTSALLPNGFGGMAKRRREVVDKYQEEVSKWSLKARRIPFGFGGA
ncbi:hypothetical protein IFM89_021437 [Coptis chinensis]|uniref:Uncharacterized protein n=1 Tax=Coptis chinensis TaxID=261450 RepID=A0A835HU38_9MAGN|nr:hypothetical protein IFM89_021437 [Coptis chinensis]